MSHDWVLLVVEGPSEAGRRGGISDGTGLVARVVQQRLGVPAEHVRVLHWRDPLPPSMPRDRPALPGFAGRAHRMLRTLPAQRHALRVLVVDADRQDLRPLRAGAAYAAAAHADRVPERLADLVEWRDGESDSELRDSTVVGVAVEMIEAWLLADDDLLGAPLPDGKQPEALWGKEGAPGSHHPKDVVKRAILGPKGITYAEALEAWQPEKARNRSFWLDAFLGDLDAVRRRRVL